MKKVLVSVLIGIAVLGAYQAQADSVYSPNIVGYVEVAVRDGLIQIAPAFNQVGEGTNDTPQTLDQVLGLGSNSTLVAFSDGSGSVMISSHDGIHACSFAGPSLSMERQNRSHSILEYR